jgi:hypothetical protein
MGGMEAYLHHSYAQTLDEYEQLASRPCRFIQREIVRCVGDWVGPRALWVRRRLVSVIHCVTAIRIR